MGSMYLYADHKVSAPIEDDVEVTKALHVASNTGGTIPKGTGNLKCRERAITVTNGHQIPPMTPTKMFANPPNHNAPFRTGP